MQTMATSSVISDPAAILDRHAVRRNCGVSTISVLVGPTAIGRRTWQRWVTSTGRRAVLASPEISPEAGWVQDVVRNANLAEAAVMSLAGRTGRDATELLNEWRDKSGADRERYFASIPPEADDDLLQWMAIGDRTNEWADQLQTARQSDDRTGPLIASLLPERELPAIAFEVDRPGQCEPVAQAAARWALRVPAVPVAILISAELWGDYLAETPESRTKALLREGEVEIAVIDPRQVQRTLADAGADPGTVSAIVESGCDAALLDLVAEVVQTTTTPPLLPADADRARSAAERFLFEFLNTLPETTGKFELNGTLDFRFGPRLMEIDLLSRSPKVAIELDGYFHFQDTDAYRRDRTKDWELQRRGYTVLRFLSADVINQLDIIRDRILDALLAGSSGDSP